MMKFCHSILVAYRLDKLQYYMYFENVKIAPYEGCHDAELSYIEDHKNV
jgi:hypothetical protein